MWSISHRNSSLVKFPISRDPPEGGTAAAVHPQRLAASATSFQFLGIPPKGERMSQALTAEMRAQSFQFLGIPPKGELSVFLLQYDPTVFPISRDPPEGGTIVDQRYQFDMLVLFPISRDPPEGGTLHGGLPPPGSLDYVSNF